MRGLQVIDVDAAVLSSDDNAISRFRSMECAWDTDADSRWEETTQRCKKGKTRGTESTTAVRLWGRDDDGLSGCVIICDTWFPLYWQFSALAPPSREAGTMRRHREKRREIKVSSLCQGLQKLLRLDLGRKRTLLTRKCHVATRRNYMCYPSKSIASSS